MRAYMLSESRDLKKSLDKGFDDGKIKEKRETARRGLEKKYPIEMIANITGLSIEDIEKLNLPASS